MVHPLKTSKSDLSIYYLRIILVTEFLGVRVVLSGSTFPGAGCIKGV